MIYLYAFLFAGSMCLIGQLILDNTKLTPGHITSMFTVMGAILSFLGFYDILLNYCGGGATTIITNFGHSLYSSGIRGYHESGILGIFTGLLCKPSAAIASSVVFSFIITLFFNPKD